MLRAAVLTNPRGCFNRALLQTTRNVLASKSHAGGMDYSTAVLLKYKPHLLSLSNASGGPSVLLGRYYADDPKSSAASCDPANLSGIIGGAAPATGSNVAPTAPQPIALGNITTHNTAQVSSPIVNMSKDDGPTKAVNQRGKAPIAPQPAEARAEKAQTVQSAAGSDAEKQIKDIMANLPSKEQVEKFFFRVVAFIYDVTYLTANWIIRFIDQNVVQNDTVKLYWKKFHDKMEAAKKD